LGIGKFPFGIVSSRLVVQGSTSAWSLVLPKDFVVLGPSKQSVLEVHAVTRYMFETTNLDWNSMGISKFQSGIVSSPWVVQGSTSPWSLELRKDFVVLGTSKRSDLSGGTRTFETTGLD
jgi:hypothetical protein